MFVTTMVPELSNFEFTARGWTKRVLWLVAVAFLSAFAPQTLSGAAEIALESQILQGEQFLRGLFDPSLALLPEYRGAKVYWLYHDNYLAAKVLKSSSPELSSRIEKSIHAFGVSYSGKIEILFDEAPQGFPFRVYELIQVTNVAGKSLRTERVTEKILKGWEAYADLLLMASIAKAKTEPREATGYFQKALSLWDGHGFNDPASSKSGLYATYKLALAVIAADRVKDKLPIREPVVEQLKRLQSPAGGWITDYDREGKARGLANVETTCLVLMALRLEAHGRR